jgi:PAS domain S-box-containing protein
VKIVSAGEVRNMNKIDNAKKKLLKEIIKRLPSAARPEEVKEKFKDVLKDVTSEDIIKIEQELVKEGMPREELQKLCNIHMAMFGEQLAGQELLLARGHPISILIEEHRIMLERAEKLEEFIGLVEGACDSVYVGDIITELQSIAKDFQDSEKHYAREENVVFPIAEKHGMTEPPAIMWIEHDEIREVERKFMSLLEKWNTMTFEEFKKRLTETAKPLCNLLPSHFYKENNILFPAILEVTSIDEWIEARKEFDEIGYPTFTPATATVKMKSGKTRSPKDLQGEAELKFENGSLSKEEVEGILDTLPIDLSFVDKSDRVKYFNKAEKRIFVRTKSVIGRKVELCHPQKSVQVVKKIVEAFKTGRKDVAEFRINMGGRLVHIRYFAVRDQNKKYLGTLEVTQDLTDIKKIEGEKRLLDWAE